MRNIGSEIHKRFTFLIGVLPFDESLKGTLIAHFFNIRQVSIETYGPAIRRLKDE